MAFADEPVQARLRDAPSGLEIARYWQRTSSQLPDDARRLLSHIASSLMSRGWLPAADKVLESAADQLGEPLPRVQQWAAQLAAIDLLHVVDGKIAVVAGLLSTRPTGLTFHFDDRHEIHLNGPLAALAVSRALRRQGEIRAACADDGTTRLRLEVDGDGIAGRYPEDLAVFLPAWDGQQAPTVVARGGGFFRSDEALDAWHARHGAPDGMPLASVLFPMAAAELGEQLGAALEAVLNHLPDFD
jgi:hypothetical protein